MKIKLEPEVLPGPVGHGVLTHAQMREAAEAMFNSSEYIDLFGEPAPPTPRDVATARQVLQEKRPASAVQNTATAQHLRALLTEYDVVVAQNAAQLRLFVTNGLLEEAAPGNRNRLKALELLGKISEVGLFTERSEVTVRHQTTTELEQRVREKLALLVQKKSAAQDVSVHNVDTDAIKESVDEVTDLLMRPDEP